MFTTVSRAELAHMYQRDARTASKVERAALEVQRKQWAASAVRAHLTAGQNMLLTLYAGYRKLGLRSAQ